MTPDTKSAVVSSNPPLHITATRLGWIICILGAVFYCYEYLLRIAPAVMVPELRDAFHLDATAFGALVGLYYLVYTPMQAIVGLTHDLYGPKRVLTFAVFACMAGSLLFGLAQSSEVAAAGRLLMGFGSAFAFVGALKLASVWLPSNRFAMFAGSITALGTAGGMFGNIFMSRFVEHVGWKETYFLGAASGVVLMILIWFVVKDRPAHQQEHHAKSKLTYRETFHGLGVIFKSRQMWVVGAVACALYLSLSAFAELWGNNFVEKAYGFSVADAATINSMVFMGWLIGSPLMGFISDKIRLRRPPLIISSFVACILSILMLTTTHPSLHIACGLFFLFGFFCSAQVICFALGRENAPKEVSGSAVAFVNLVVMAGGLVAQPLIGKLLDYYWTGTLLHDTRVYSGENFKSAMILLPIGLGLSFIAAFFIRETRAEMVGKSISDVKK
jgi:sugar phosphate permease